MARQPDQTKTALLVIDVQTAVIAHAPNREQVLANINNLVDRARTADVPVIWVQHHDEEMPYESEGWEIASELTRAPHEPIVHKQRRSSFDGTDLGQTLAELGVGKLIVAGAQSDFCVRWTLHGALEHGYDTTLVSDAHTTDDPPTDAFPSAAQTVALLNSVWGSQETAGNEALVMSTSDVVFPG